MGFLFGLAPGGVYLAANCCQSRGALLPHHFTLTHYLSQGNGRYTFCCTFRGFTPPRRYLAPCSAEPGLSSPRALAGRQTATVQLTQAQCIAVAGGSQPCRHAGANRVYKESPRRAAR